MSKDFPGCKVYTSIGHLPTSKLGEGDHRISDSDAKAFTEKTRQRADRVIVRQKLDGSCVAVAHHEDGSVVAYIRAGHRAWSSHFEQHILFARWVQEREENFRAVLQPGERLVGEWMAQSHGIRYALPHDPFVPFDVMIGPERQPNVYLENVAARLDLTLPQLISNGPAICTHEAMARLSASHHGALDEPEGVVYRMERGDRVIGIAKHVRHDFVPGKYLPLVSGSATVWNTYPGSPAKEPHP